LLSVVDFYVGGKDVLTKKRRKTILKTKGLKKKIAKNFLFKNIKLRTCFMQKICWNTGWISRLFSFF